MLKWLLLCGVGIAAIVLIGWRGLPNLSQTVAEAALGQKLDGLVGRTGLDPLDPVQPLRSVQLLRIDRSATGGEEARIRFTYADGSSRVYVTWLANRQEPFGGWQYTGLDRAFASQQELPGLPAADGHVSLDLGQPVRLTALDAVGVPAGDPGRWFDTALLTPRSTWAPGGDAVLLGRLASNGSEFSLWLAPLDGSPPRHLADRVIAAEWTPDGQGIAVLEWPSQPDDHDSRLALMDRQGKVRWSLVVPSDPAPPFATTAHGVLFAQGDALWLMPNAAAPNSRPERLRDLPDIRHARESFEPAPPIAPSPSGDRLAYVCGLDVCLADLRGGVPRRIRLAPLGPALSLDGSAAASPTPLATATPLAPPPTAPPSTRPTSSDGPGPKPTAPPLDPSSLVRIRLAWSPDGQRLAVAHSSTEAYWCATHLCGRYQPRLAILDRSGRVLSDVGIGPDGFVDTPQWTPDGDKVFLPAYPENGRRIVAVAVDSGRVVDLSRPRWDAFFALSPDGTRLFLTNGRGGFWLAPVG